MINQTSLSSQLALDAKGSAGLQRAASLNSTQHSPDALKTVAKQFEALFMNMVMKSMREASPQDGVFDSEQSRMYASMLDQKISESMASRGIGLGDALFRQLSKQQAAAADAAGTGASPAQASPGTARLPAGVPVAASAPLAERAGSAISAVAGSIAGAISRVPAHVQAFQARLAAHAEEASRATGIPAKFMLGQAALESGWGKREIIAADGTNSHNVFGIKATGGWKGRVVETQTTEYINGVAHKKTEKFRAYDSYADAFRDYAGMMRKNPRYENVIAQGADAQGFAYALQRAGYATDPNYAAKLSNIIRHSLA